MDAFKLFHARAQSYAFTARYFKEVLIWDACHFCRIIMLTLSKQVSNELKTYVDRYNKTNSSDNNNTNGHIADGVDGV